MCRCPLIGEPLSNELWARDATLEWSLVGGTTARSLLNADITPVGSNGGWPAARSAAASWNIPSETSDKNVLNPLAVIFGGAFPAPCSSSTNTITVENLLSPSDLWVYSRVQNGTNTRSKWTIVGGEQSWAP
jgi:hypothetical protein